MFVHIYGIHAAIAAVQNPERKVNTILCTQQVFDNYKSIISKHKYKIVTNVNYHKQQTQGILVEASTIFSNGIADDIIINASNIVILDQITNSQNIGAIVRNAAAFKIDAVIMQSCNAPDENPIIAKAAVGALEMVRIIKVVNLKRAMDFLRKHKFQIVGLDLSGDQKNWQNVLSINKLVIVLGSEHNGLRRLTRDACDFLIKIPHAAIDSLNVSSVSAIIFHKIYDNNK